MLGMRWSWGAPTGIRNVYALAHRRPDMNIFKLASLGLALTGLLTSSSGDFGARTEHRPTWDCRCGNVVLLFSSICILVIGVGIMHGRREFRDEATA